jgi:hypothetical protein
MADHALIFSAFDKKDGAIAFLIAGDEVMQAILNQKGLFFIHYISLGVYVFYTDALSVRIENYC